MVFSRRLVLQPTQCYRQVVERTSLKEKKMLDFKLIPADDNINEPPAAWKRVQKEYGDRAPKVVKDPEGFKGIWVITDGLPPSPCSNYSIGHVVSKPGGLGSVDMDKHHQRIHFHETFKYEDFLASWEPAAR